MGTTLLARENSSMTASEPESMYHELMEAEILIHKHLFYETQDEIDMIILANQVTDKILPTLTEEEHAYYIERFDLVEEYDFSPKMRIIGCAKMLKEYLRSRSEAFEMQDLTPQKSAMQQITDSAT